MNILCIVIWQLVVIAVAGDENAYNNETLNQLIKSRYKRTLHFNKLTLIVKINGKREIIELIPTNQLLANEHLPVWISSNSQSEQHEKLHDIMKNNVGDFTMYHDYYTRSAIVYFHKRRELDGIIKIKYKIEGLSVDKLNEEHVITSGHAGTKLKRFFFPLRQTNRCTSGIETCRIPNIKIYPELLIAVSHDMFQSIEKNSKFPRGVKTIFHVLTSYNVADMLLRYVKSAQISLNIAGIVIEGTKNGWGFVTDGLCHSYISAEKINDQVDEYFRSREQFYPRYSYDYVVYNTRKVILTSLKTPLFGVAVPAGSSHMFYSHEYPYRYNFVIKDLKTYGHYTTIAHEFAHVLGAEHDQTFNWFFVPSCDRSVMAACDFSSRFCLKWNDKIEKQLEIFFSSPSHCILKNKPRSLFPPNPRKVLSKLDQCRCYGFQTVYTPDNPQFLKHQCSRNLICKNARGYIQQNLPYPMDGTPCHDHDKNKVCWEEKCVEAAEI